MADHFDLLQYLDDNSLLATLGLEPTLANDNSNVKLRADTPYNYTELAPLTPLPVGSLSDNTYYTIDTEAPINNPLEPLQLNSTTYLSSPDIGNCENISQDTSVIIVSSSECETDPPVSIAFKEPLLESDPAVIDTSGSVPQNECNSKAETPPKKRRRRNRPRKEKVYEISEPLQDPLKEKQRLNAINAKKNRDKKRDQLKNLDFRVKTVTRERDLLRAEVEMLRKRENELRRQFQEKYNRSLPSF
ncbi:hypothetical protein SK128_000225 [Halocaridina rubra]|uniref:BZIP domain-containing protein n=1 Tax=Halocaridina rubra TaxID=373956 RepID=A0AAN9A1X6_HALRR